ncbi:helix-turn-helix domain-containing protein [Streptomyces sp. BI20]|uniref:helix-turn-helix domain-containing protein n=1 Tax=Streptomyces sp. BI20 TaxID=3403460 RepID=UPI003C7141FB
MTEHGGPAGGRGRGVVEGAFAVLEALRRTGEEAGVTELAEACGVPKGSVHRLLDQLVAVGAVERWGSRYRVGPELYRIGQAWQPHPGLRAAARLPSHRLRAATGASVVVTVLHEDLALTVASVPGAGEVLVPVRNGAGFPLETAAGRALCGPRGDGPTWDRGGLVPGVSCVALPVRTAGARLPVAAVAAVLPERAVSGAGEGAGGAERVVRAVAEAAAAVARGLARPVREPTGLPRGLLR